MDVELEVKGLDPFLALPLNSSEALVSSGFSSSVSGKGWMSSGWQRGFHSNAICSLWVETGGRAG